MHSVAMRKLPACALSAIVPTEDEKEFAKQQRVAMTVKQKASAKTTVRQFLQKIPYANASKMKGNVTLLDMYLIHGFRTNTTAKTITNERNVSKDKKNTRSYIGMAKLTNVPPLGRSALTIGSSRH